MAAAILVPMSTIHLNGGVLPSSAITGEHSPRHGRRRGASVSTAKKGGRGRGYSLVDDRETTVSKAVVFVLKRASPTQQGRESNDEDDGDKIVADADGWVTLEDVLSHPKVSVLAVTLAEVQDLASSTTAKTRRISLRQRPSTDASDPASYEIRRTPPDTPTAATQSTQTSSSSSSPSTWTRITASTPGLPEFILYETSYPKYHLILSSGSIKRAGGQPFLSFTPVVDDVATASVTKTADVSIWIHLPSALASRPDVAWQRSDAGAIVTVDEVPTTLWTRAVARRGDLGVLFEEGVVRKEIPVGLRGKGAKSKKGKGALKSRVSDTDDGSDSASAEE
ncbi:hypothetical protein VTK73DRAFT_8868 [Phialemonium thermophilum]|uniref:Uncharacterized protein n=1 Tax=Phialemonium thermophilum TaxID=223376 RepID=A0ABR3W5Q4_9PEZI